jgi:uncharacterized protein
MSATSTTETTREVVARMYQAGVDGDFAAFMACIHPDIELDEPAWLPYGGTHRGLEAIQNVFVEVGKLLDLASIDVQSIIADGDQAVGLFRARTQSGAEVSNAEVWTVRDGLVWRGRVFYQDPTPVQELIRAQA